MYVRFHDPDFGPRPPRYKKRKVTRARETRDPHEASQSPRYSETNSSSAQYGFSKRRDENEPGESQRCAETTSSGAQSLFSRHRDKHETNVKSPRYGPTPGNGAEKVYAGHPQYAEGTGGSPRSHFANQTEAWHVSAGELCL